VEVLAPRYPKSVAIQRNLSANALINVRALSDARSRKIIRMVLSEVSLLAAAGLAAGMVVALAVSKLVESVRLRNRGSRWSA
jgi:hypothetical protein